ncbi:MAG: diaminopimelate epimerase [Phycisphaerae bacterium]
MRFTKMQALGNDYVYVDGSSEKLDDPGTVAKVISDRHFGVGADGLILILPSKTADVRMRMFNADGSEGEMCGNGIRCVAKYAYDHGLARSNPMRVETAAGIKKLELILSDDGTVSAATVDMGEPVLEAERIPVAIPQKRVIDAPVRVRKYAYNMTCVSMGNPHAVIFVNDLTDVPLEEVGPELERNPLFPQRVNTHFVQVIAPGEVRMRTWERGSGATLACGTGASAVCVAGVLTGRCEREITAHLPGGTLTLQWREDDDHVYMTGPAVEVFTGDWPDEG